jgi:hypothetical protein
MPTVEVAVVGEVAVDFLPMLPARLDGLEMSKLRCELSLREPGDGRDLVGVALRCPLVFWLFTLLIEYLMSWDPLTAGNGATNGPVFVWNCWNCCECCCR